MDRQTRLMLPNLLSPCFAKVQNKKNYVSITDSIRYFILVMFSAEDDESKAGPSKSKVKMSKKPDISSDAGHSSK